MDKSYQSYDTESTLGLKAKQKFSAMMLKTAIDCCRPFQCMGTQTSCVLIYGIANMYIVHINHMK